MTALELLNLITQVLFVGLFVAALQRAVLVPTRTSLDVLLLFGSIASVVIVGEVTERLGLGDHPFVVGLTIALLSITPVAMVRLVGDFRGQPAWIAIGGHLAFVGVVALGFVGLETAIELVELALIAFFAIVGGYATVAFAREAGQTRGITRRRMLAVATGGGLFIAAIVLFIVAALLPVSAPVIQVVGQLMLLGAVGGFWIGFMPPSWVRQALREPELRRFLDRSIRLGGLADDRDVLTELQAAVTDAFGAGGSSIGLASADGTVLRYVARATNDWRDIPSGEYVAGQAYTEGRSLIFRDTVRTDPEHADEYRRVSATTVLATPIRGEDRRLGVLVVYAGREPIFAEDDLLLLELMADQLGVLFDARTLTRRATDMQAREETARMKEEFLASAAHDLRSPLTVVLGQAEILERRVMRDPDRPVDPAGVSRLAREARRLRDLVNNLLDAQRLEQGGLGITRAPVDVGAVVSEIENHLREEGRTIDVQRPAVPLIGMLDRARIGQVITNLIENARKYGPEDGHPRIVVEAHPGEVRIAVVDHGIGIPEAERERIFERFYRASNAQRVTDTGLGLGLYICRRIVEEHGGRIWHEPTQGGGSTFVVALPLADAAPPSMPDAGAGAEQVDPLTRPMNEAAADA